MRSAPVSLTPWGFEYELRAIVLDRVRKSLKNEEAVEKDLQPAQHPTLLLHDYSLNNSQVKNLSGKKA
jgi:hypothetical protein